MVPGAYLSIAKNLKVDQDWTNHINIFISVTILSWTENWSSAWSLAIYSLEGLMM